jgi:hypothetical protein
MSRVIALVSKTKSKYVYNNIKENSFRMNTGSTGETGNTGNTGVTGGTRVGPYGRYGSFGESGEKGMTGSMSVVGDNGPSGITGQQGSVGPQPDFIGPTGHQGDDGFTGNKGSNGNRGALGATGVSGATGSTGNDGLTGLTGIDGLVGASGFTGVTGSFGEDGKVGYTGPVGFSGYAGVRGVTGATGFVGLNGTDGLTGEDGVNGLAGAIGFIGSTGQGGAQGRDGPIGTNGLIGFTGEIGFTGSSLTSTTGPTGVSGLKGGLTIGYNGMTGLKGVTGPIGDLYASQITNLQTLTSKFYKTNDTLVLDGDFVEYGTFTTITPKKISNKILNYPVPSSGALLGTSNPGANMMCSGDGRYVSLCASGCVHVSKDYGKTFTLKTFDSVIYAIAVNSTGKYQCCVSTGVPKACINVSNNFGETWTETLVTGSAYDKWLSSVSISSSGKYIYCSGGGGTSMSNWSSNNFGLTFSIGGSIQNKTSSSVNDAGRVISITSGGRYFTTDLASTITEVTRGILSSTTGQYFVSMNQESSGYVSVGPAGFVHNPTPFSSVIGLTTRTTPEVFLQAQIIIGNKIWARSSTAIYTSINLGVSWTKVHYTPIPIKTMHITHDSMFLYILLINGDVIRTTIYLPPTRIIGSKKVFFDSPPYPLQSFGVLVRPIYIPVPIGKWIITYGFKMGSNSSLGNCVNSNIHHGIGGTEVGEEFLYASNHSTYGITFGDSSTYQVFSNSFIMTLSKSTELNLNIKLLNSPVNGATSAFVYDMFLEYKFISM